MRPKPGAGDQSMPADPGESLGKLALGLHNLRLKYKGFRASLLFLLPFSPPVGRWARFLYLVLES